MNTHRVFDGPVREVGRVAQVLEVVDVAKQLILEGGIGDVGDGAVLVLSTRVWEKAGGEVRQVGGQAFDHVAPHRVVPDDLATIIQKMYYWKK